MFCRWSTAVPRRSVTQYQYHRNHHRPRSGILRNRRTPRSCIPVLARMLVHLLNLPHLSLKSLPRLITLGRSGPLLLNLTTRFPNGLPSRLETWYLNIRYTLSLTASSRTLGAPLCTRVRASGRLDPPASSRLYVPAFFLLSHLLPVACTLPCPRQHPPGGRRPTKHNQIS